MLTASRAWVRTSHAHSQGFGGGGGGGGGSLGHIGRCQKAHRRKLLMCSEGVKRDAGLWYSRKRKKRGGHLQEAEEGGGGSGAEEGEMAGKVERGVCPDMASSLSVCSDCGTSRTPLWRRGPAGPKSLCNACGIRYRKAKRYGATPSTAVADQRRNDGGGRKTPTPSKTASSSAGSIELRKEAKLRRRWETLWLLMEESGKLELSSGKEAVEAAMLLMAMSSGLFVHTY